MSHQYVMLEKDKDYVYCFKDEKVILEEDCDYYEHNLECDKKHDVFNRTHLRGSNAGYQYGEVSGTVLNDCKYCLNESVKYEKYWLPEDAKPKDVAVNRVGFWGRLLGR